MSAEGCFSNMGFGKRKLLPPTTLDLYLKKRAQEKCRKVYSLCVSKLSK